MNTRRAFLGAGVGLAAALAGCLGGGGGEGTVRTLAVNGLAGGRLAVKPAGEPALLDFWATWCAPCKPQMTELREIRERFPDLHMLSITNETDEPAIRAFWEEYEGTWPVAMDPDLETNDRYTVTRLPTLIVLDSAGTEVWRHVGLAGTETIARRLGEAGA